jgi:IS5 family transposase
LDTTAVETNIHWPTDSTLLVDLYRSTKRCLDQVRDFDASLLHGRRFHLHAVKKLALRITRKGGRKGTSTDALKPLYKRLIDHAEQILSSASRTATELRRTGDRDTRPQREAFAERIDSLRTVGAPLLSQARRRVLQGESVPNDQKIFSIFEPHTELLKRGKAGKPIEFGHMIQIQQVDEKFITDYAVFEKKPAEPALLEDALASHRGLFGENPSRLAADKGYYEGSVLEKLRERIEVVSIAKKGKRTAGETEEEHDPIFRHAQRFRAGVEGTISYLQRVLGLARCLCKGWKNYQSTIGASIFAHNLLILARI